VPSPLESILAARRVVIAVGAGGVGKTTTAAALAVAAAQRGKRVLCLTIDPARRLAESLGLERMATEAVRIDPARFTAAGVRPLEGSLTVMMLETKRTFDELIERYASSKEKARRILDNKIYGYVSTSLAGTQEYMAMEKLVAVKEDPAYDLVILDTPPTANALDFLDAPERLMEALDSAAMKYFVEAFQSTGKLSLNVLARSAAAVLRTIGKITGGSFLQDLAGFISELNELFGGFKQRAALVQRTLRAPDVTFVLVTSPSPMSIQEVLYFADRLEEHAMPRGAFVVNRFHVPPPFAAGASPGASAQAAPITEAAAGRAARERGVHLDDDAPARLVRAHADAVRLAALDALHVRVLGERARGAVPIVRVPELASDVYDVRLLSELADVLMRGGVA